MWYQRRGVRVGLRTACNYITSPGVIVEIITKVVIIMVTCSRLRVTASICIILRITSLLFRLGGSDLEDVSLDL